MCNLVKKFEKNWMEETRRQASLGLRAREFLLRWGEFSDAYVQQAEFMCPSNQKSVKDWLNTVMFGLILTIATPCFAISLFIFDISTNISDDVFITSLWVAGVFSIVAISLNIPIKHALISIKPGTHNLIALSYLFVSNFLISYSFRNLFGVDVIPFECIFISMFGILISNKIFLDTKFIRTVDPRSGKLVWTSLRPYMALPPSLRFSEKAKSDSARALSMIFLCYIYGLACTFTRLCVSIL